MKIALTRGMFATVDADDYSKVCRHKWYAHSCNGNIYAATKLKRGGKPSVMLMHRFILDAGSGSSVDHKNGDRLDNRRSNIRFATHAQNMANRKTAKHNKLGIKAINFDSRRNRFVVRLTKDGLDYKTSVKTLDLAIKIRDAVGKTLHGEFWRPN